MLCSFTLKATVDLTIYYLSLSICKKDFESRRERHHFLVFVVYLIIIILFG